MLFYQIKNKSSRKIKYTFKYIKKFPYYFYLKRKFNHCNFFYDLHSHEK